MATRIKRKVGGCEIIENVIRGRRYFKCKNLKRPPNAQEIIDQLNTKIKYK